MNITVTFVGGPLHGNRVEIDSDLAEVEHVDEASNSQLRYLKRIWRADLPGAGNYLDQVFFVLSTLGDEEAATLVGQIGGPKSAS